uniref:Uncharacterized protein n=1 Tax=Amphimedon queenslandica TaxID=400682 RepID=A0A1X7UJ37_AMPQE
MITKICKIKIHQSPKFSNSSNFSPSKISHYTVHRVLPRIKLEVVGD